MLEFNLDDARYAVFDAIRGQQRQMFAAINVGISFWCMGAEAAGFLRPRFQRAIMANEDDLIRVNFAA